MSEDDDFIKKNDGNAGSSKKEMNDDESIPPSENDDVSKKSDDVAGSNDNNMSEDELMAQFQEQMAKTPVIDFVAQFLMTLSSLAWQRMGIYQDPSSTTTDFDQAKLAIDCYSAIVEKVGNSLDEETRKAVDGVLSSLRMKYIEKNK